MTHTNQEILSMFQNASDLPRTGASYKHYKGALYTVINIGIEESTKKIQVCYVPTNSKEHLFYWVRSLEEWNRPLQRGKDTLRRFTLVE